jgi:hypothetical protein
VEVVVDSQARLYKRRALRREGMKNADRRGQPARPALVEAHYTLCMQLVCDSFMNPRNDNFQTGKSLRRKPARIGANRGGGGRVARRGHF